MNQFIVCYDIADDKRCQRAAQFLDAYADRIEVSRLDVSCGCTHLGRMGYAGILPP